MRFTACVSLACLTALIASGATWAEDVRLVEIDVHDKPLAAVVDYLREASGW